MTQSLEEYLKTIYQLINGKGSARVTDIANILGYSKSSVSRAINSLKEKGYINYQVYGNIDITDKGSKKVCEILKKHNTLKVFLSDILKVDVCTSEEEAKLMRSSISEDTINKLEQYIHTVIDFSKYDCNYNPLSKRCLNCWKKEDRKGKLK